MNNINNINRINKILITIFIIFVSASIFVAGRNYQISKDIKSIEELKEKYQELADEFKDYKANSYYIKK